MKVALVGASGQLAVPLVRLLVGSGHEVIALSRSKADLPGVKVLSYGSSLTAATTTIGPLDAVVSVAPLPLIGDVVELARLSSAARIVAFGSASVLYKGSSSSALERDFVQQQRHAESLLASAADEAGVGWTLIRPTMIYGAGDDLNVAVLSRLVRRSPVFPIPFGAHGLRQPVHVEDLAKAAFSALKQEVALGRAYNVGGGERLAYGEFVRRIIRHQHSRCVILRVPRTVLSLVMALLRHREGFQYLREEMIDRMFDDLTVDNSVVERELGLAPRPFLPDDED